ncbi:sensor histidine kinase [Pelosinus propionicus]|uniref:histidine kinase n=1 Tax=Pelosinus propionicus DSM 13327 TaxID=1123291 RepID=A0A1I4QAU2_9FIRM|nr:HAMP domain-containing sensor histidine kinase [Pelosinus propionicus]SFM37167.1 His Kinase A (phospho-acceptor) domain-containing protein [Pelosinus propionicus DSM 13327]
MISKTHKKLTTVYTAVFGLFLIAFVGIVCLGIIWGTYVERTEDVKVLANEIARENRGLILQHAQKETNGPPLATTEDDYDISGQVFFYIVDTKGQIIKADQPVPVLRESAYFQIMNWNPLESTKITTVKLPTNKTAVLILAAHQVQRGENLLATVYVGRDVTAYARSLLRSVFTLMAVSFIFLFLAAMIGYFLAGKVTTPMEESMKRKKQFIADASHELRTPLSVLFTSIEAVEMDMDNRLSPFSMQIMNDAKEESFRLKKLVDDLLTLARTDTGEIELKKEVFSLTLITKQVLRSLRFAADEKEIKILFDAADSMDLNADPERIYQLLFILIDNSIKYSSPNSEVRVQFKKVQNTTGCYTQIAVTDDGPGIPFECKEQIFQRFFRVDASRSRDIEGSGLGLSIAQWIVEAHEGEIYVNSELNKGSEFVVLLPNP